MLSRFVVAVVVGGLAARGGVAQSAVRAAWLAEIDAGEHSCRGSTFELEHRIHRDSDSDVDVMRVDLTFGADHVAYDCCHRTPGVDDWRDEEYRLCISQAGARAMLEFVNRRGYLEQANPDGVVDHRIAADPFLWAWGLWPSDLQRPSFPVAPVSLRGLLGTAPSLVLGDAGTASLVCATEAVELLTSPTAIRRRTWRNEAGRTLRELKVFDWLVWRGVRLPRRWQLSGYDATRAGAPIVVTRIESRLLGVRDDHEPLRDPRAIPGMVREDFEINESLQVAPGGLELADAQARRLSAMPRYRAADPTVSLALVAIGLGLLAAKSQRGRRAARA